MADQDDDFSGISTATRNLDWAAALVRGLAEGGIRHVVVSPGSRSTPLVIAFNSCPYVSLQVMPDERSAAFLALGLARSTTIATAVVCTSGTAAANWYPAVVEASMDDIPLVLITADRPSELIDSGANQTIDQRRLYGIYPRAFIDLPPPGDDNDGSQVAYAAGQKAAGIAHDRSRGPVHINAAFQEPLVPPADFTRPDWPEILRSSTASPAMPPNPDDVKDLVSDINDQPGLIVCGRNVFTGDFAGAIVALANRLDCPVIADPLSGLRWGRHDRKRLVCSADLFLRSARLRSQLRPQWALQFGGAPTSAAVLKLLAEIGHGLNLVSDCDRWADPSRRSGRRIASGPLPLIQALLDMNLSPVDPGWSGMWREMDGLGHVLAQRPELRPAEASLVAAIEAALPTAARLFVGNSMVIRSFDAFATGRSEPLAVFGNRGASGIDGNVSTVLGIASDVGAPVVGVIGDLTLYHDMNGLLAAQGLNATLIVINNGGGGIFDLLPQRDMDDFDRLWLTPTGLRIKRIARLYELRYEKVASVEQLGASVSRSIARSGVDLIEFPVDRTDSSERLKRLWAEAEALALDSAQIRSL